ncbi:MAG TPA: hypothetical protein VGL26_05665 [Jatrophihabitans sp.]|jgi:hypothetical protein
MALPGPVLEVGSGPGRDADYPEAQGLPVVRTDASNGFIEYQRSRGKSITPLNLLRDELGGPYAGLLADAVLLHLQRTQLKDVLVRARGAVVPRGVFALTVKEGDESSWSSAKLDRPRHFTYWRENEVREVLGRAGWAARAGPRGLGRPLPAARRRTGRAVALRSRHGTGLATSRG